MSLGWALCEVASGSKGPRAAAWNRPEKAIREPGQACRLTGAGLLHAYSGTCALDLDDLAGAAAWLEAHDVDLGELLAADDAVQIRSGRPNRAKLLYRLPAGVAPLPTRKVESGGAVLLELRCASTDGLSVQDVLPPTVHPETGRPYEWAGAGDWHDLPELPAALLHAWRNLGSAPTESHTEPAADEVASPETLADLRSALCALDADDYQRWISVGMQLRRLGNAGRALWLEWSQTSEKYDPADAARRWRGFKPTSTGYQAVFTAAQAADWVNPRSRVAAAPRDADETCETADDFDEVDPLAALARFEVTDEQVQQMRETRMVWGGRLAVSHLAAWCSPANGGKTTLAKACAADLAGDFTVLFFQEDASAGDLPGLHAHAQAHGYRLLNSTLAGCSPDDQIKVLRSLVKKGAALDGYLLVFDTLKKFADLMSKGGTRAFFQLMRSLTQLGATVVLLGHTNKHKGPDGKLIFEGVGDVRNDVDELVYIEATPKDASGHVTLTMRPDKVRCAMQESSFQLDTATMELRPLDRVVDVAALLEAERRRHEDAGAIAFITTALRQGGMPYSALVDAVVRESGMARDRIRAVIDRYLGHEPNDARALWLETRLRVNNTRYVSLKPEASQ